MGSAKIRWDGRSQRPASSIALIYSLVTGLSRSQESTSHRGSHEYGLHNSAGKGI